jgi:hypothetical protein
MNALLLACWTILQPGMKIFSANLEHPPGKVETTVVRVYR